MANYYAQLNENNICIGISDLSGEVFQDNMIHIVDYDTELLGKKYNNGVWEEVEQPTPEPIPITETEQAILDTAVNTEYLVCLVDMGI